MSPRRQGHANTKNIQWVRHSTLVFVVCMLTPETSALQRKKETRKRNLSFHLPAAVSCSPTLRLFQTDTSYITLGDIYEFHCEDAGISREEPILFAGEKIKKTLRELKQNPSRQVGRFYRTAGRIQLISLTDS